MNKSRVHINNKFVAKLSFRGEAATRNLMQNNDSSHAFGMICKSCNKSIIKGKFLRIIAVAVFISVFADINFIALRAEQKVLGIILSSSQLHYNENIIKGFKESFSDASFKILNLEGAVDEGKIRRFITKESPAVLICLGALASTTAAKVESGIPIIYSKVLNSWQYGQLQSKNITGISEEIHPVKIFTKFRVFYPRLKSVGIAYGSASFEPIIKKIAGQLSGSVNVFSIKIDDPDRIIEVLESKRSLFNALWLISDGKLYNKNNSAAEDIVSYSIGKKIPLLAHSHLFVKAGALFSLSIDDELLGNQLASICKRIVVDGVLPKDLPVDTPTGIFTALNRETAKAVLGNEYDDSIADIVDKVFPEDE